MTNKNRLCDGNCIQFKAIKPKIGGRYTAGQFRCQICEIYLTKEGVNENSCKCCNYRVRSKPRNSLYKEKFHDIIQKSHQIGVSINDLNNKKKINKLNRINELINEKKSSPIYEEIDESVKTYYELKEFLESKIKPQANYQYVMLKELLEYGKLHQGEIAESLAYFNNKDTTDIDTIKYYLNVPVYDVLLKHKFVTSDDGYYFPYFTLNVKLEDFQRIELIDYFTNAISIYNEKHDIPENEFPNSNNMDSIEWVDINVKNSLKIQENKNFVKKISASPTRSFWIWSVTPENWEIVKSKNVWGSRIPKERIGKKVKAGDQVIFYVIGSNAFKGIFEFVGEWFDSLGKLWDNDLEPNGSLRFKSRINLRPIQLGFVNVHDLYDKIKLFIGKPQNIRNLLLQGGSGYPSNNSRPLLNSDFEIIKEHLAQKPTEDV